MELPFTTIERLDRPALSSDVQALAILLVNAVESGAAVSFTLPVSLVQAEEWWRRTLEGSHPKAVFLVARVEGRIIGTVQLHPAWAPNQPHRADIAKLLVHTDFRRSGIGAKLMNAADEAARQLGFTLLTLDAKQGAPAERLYRSLGWVEVGVIPRYAVDPDGKGLHGTIIFYKELAGTPPRAPD